MKKGSRKYYYTRLSIDTWLALPSFKRVPYIFSTGVIGSGVGCVELNEREHVHTGLYRRLSLLFEHA